ncbi:GntR family transcriptional regulator [Roseomonas elaeocarpi]|uniref:GntR family transcriptional regulator n=1 Tax=Roseomonas elaeocarpi TaxID=907779 RepID=A0ABV6JNI6_9PROT
MSGIAEKPSARPPSRRRVTGWHELVDRIAADVQGGRLAPGTWLKQIDLEQRYGFSRGDVRRALDELVARRLVRHVPNRGHHVFELAGSDIANLVQVRAILEGALGEVIHDRATPAALAALEAAQQRFETDVEKGTPLEQHNSNLLFHQLLVELCPNPELRRLITETRNRMPSALIYQWSTRGWVQQSIRDHITIIEALRARDKDALRDAMVAHLRVGQRFQGLGS